MNSCSNSCLTEFQTQQENLKMILFQALISFHPSTTTCSDECRITPTCSTCTSLKWCTLASSVELRRKINELNTYIWFKVEPDKLPCHFEILHITPLTYFEVFYTLLVLSLSLIACFLFPFNCFERLLPLSSCQFALVPLLFTPIFFFFLPVFVCFHFWKAIISSVLFKLLSNKTQSGWIISFCSRNLNIWLSNSSCCLLQMASLMSHYVLCELWYQ